ncbi:MAG TPA: hypothetical protein VMB74_14420 [Streptosporangiaceae bacterium]|nr:hypothetical protein [Streptosporangiaceae bacterium]
MLEQSLRKLFQQQAEQAPPPGRVTVAQVLRQGRLRRRRHRIGAVGAPVLAASAALAVALSGALPSGILGRTGPQAVGYGRLAGGAFDPSYLAIMFGWLPKDTVVAGGMTSPAHEQIAANPTRRENWALNAYPRDVCHAITAERRFRCWPGMFPAHSTISITGRGPLIEGHGSWWLSGSSPGTAPRWLGLAWTYAPHAWAIVQNAFGLSGAATAVRIARGAEFGQHIAFRFASRFTSLPRGWQIIGLDFSGDYDAANGIPAGVYLAEDYNIADPGTISQATLQQGNFGTTSPDVPYISVNPVITGTQHCVVVNGTKTIAVTTRHVTIHGYRFVSQQQTPKHGHVQSYLSLCGGNVDGLTVNVDELAAGVHPHLALPPLQVMERLQLLGANPADWVTNPLP